MTHTEALHETIERLITKIESNDTGRWIKPFNSSFPSNYSSHTDYQGINILNLWSIAEDNNYTSNKWMTFKQLKDLGGHLKAGSKSSQVFFFKPIDFKEIDSTGEETTKKSFVLKVYNVFNICQTDLVVENDFEECLDSQSFINSLGITIKNSSSGAFYVPSQDYIGMPYQSSFNSVDSYYSTLFHEVGHSTGHTSRMNRDFTGKMHGTEEEVKSYAKEELIAETISCFMGCRFNLDIKMEEQNAAYLKSWLKPLKEDPRMLWKIFSEASKAFNYLLQISKEEIAA